MILTRFHSGLAR